MRRNTCPRCRAENLPNAVACVTCGGVLHLKRADPAASIDAADDAWIPPMPVRPVAPRSSLSSPAISGRAAAAEVEYEPIPRRPDLGRDLQADAHRETSRV